MENIILVGIVLAIVFVALCIKWNDSCSSEFHSRDRYKVAEDIEKSINKKSKT